MTNPVCKTFTYNNYAEAAAQDEAQKASKSMGDSLFGSFYEDAEPAKRIEVELTYCDVTKNSMCNRDIVTIIKQNFSPIKSMHDIYPPGNTFQRESQKWPGFNVGSVTRGEGYSSSYSRGIETREKRYYTGCFDWNAAMDGHDHIRKLAAIELPGLEPKPYVPSESIPGCIPDKPEGFATSEQNDIFQEETFERLNDAALGAFALIAASVIGYGMYSLYKRCTA